MAEDQQWPVEVVEGGVLTKNEASKVEQVVQDLLGPDQKIVGVEKKVIVKEEEVIMVRQKFREIIRNFTKMICQQVFIKSYRRSEFAGKMSNVLKLCEIVNFFRLMEHQLLWKEMREQQLKNVSLEEQFLTKIC